MEVLPSIRSLYFRFCSQFRLLTCLQGALISGSLTVSDAFTDVPTNHWANKYITRAKDLGVISGYGNKKFGPNDNVTYEQTVTMIVRAVGYMQEAQEAGGYPDGFLCVAQDNGWLDGVIAKKGEFLSRADIATVLFNYYSADILN